MCTIDQLITERAQATPDRPAVVGPNGTLSYRDLLEPYPRRVHGDAYLRYAASAGRFLHSLGRRIGTADAREPR